MPVIFGLISLGPKETLVVLLKCGQYEKFLINVDGERFSEDILGASFCYSYKMPSTVCHFHLNFKKCKKYSTTKSIVILYIRVAIIHGFPTFCLFTRVGPPWIFYLDLGTILAKILSRSCHGILFAMVRS